MALATAVLAGCSAAPGEPERSSSAVASAPGGGQLLSERGIAHGPAGFAVPKDLVITRTIDQPNVVTLVIERREAQRTLDYLRMHAAALGLTDVRTGNGSMTFRVGEWEGGFTTSTDIAGLTLRKVN